MELIEILYLTGFILATGIRKYYTGKFKPEKEQSKEGLLLDKILLALTGIAMLLPVVKIWWNMFPFANYSTLPVLPWIGLAFFIIGIYVLYRSHKDLGRNWNPQVAINENQNLVTAGIYKNIRHPMYTGHLLWALGNALIFPNWIIGPSMLVFLLLFLPQRINREERFLLAEFGEEYKNYKNSTGSLLPGIK